MAVTYGTTGPDTKKGTSGQDTMYGWAKGSNANSPSGNDTLNGLASTDILYGGTGNDILDGGAGIDILSGGKGNDTYMVDSITDIITEYECGGSGDTVRSSVSYTLGDWLDNLTLTGTSAVNGTGNSLDNTITGNIGKNILKGGAGNDTLDDGDTFDLGGAQGDSDVLYGGAGNDALLSSGHGGRDTLYGGAGDDSLTGGNRYFHGALMYGGDGNDTLESMVATMYGGNGNDSLYGDFSNVYGDDGNDTLNGFLSKLYGGNGNDTLSGGFSSIVGGDGNDVLYGYLSSSMTGGNGNDTLTGDPEPFEVDSFIFNALTEGVDTIVGFEVNTDDILVSAAGFGGGLTATAAITPEQFVIGTAAGEASHRFIYNQSTGALFFDVDGTGATAQVQFATLSAGLDISNADIFVVA